MSTTATRADGAGGTATRSGFLGRLAGVLPPGTFAVAVGTGVLGLASYVHLAAAGHALGENDMAHVSVLWTIVMSVGLGLFFPVEQELTRVVAGRLEHRDGAAPVLRRGTWLAGGIFVVVSGVLLAAAGPLADTFFDGDSVLVLALVGALFGLAVSYVTRGVLAGAGHFGAYGLQLGLDGGLRIALALGLALAGVDSALAYCLILTAAPVVATVVTLPPVLRVATAGTLVPWRQLVRGLGLLICSTVLAQVVVNVAVISAKLLDPDDTALVTALLAALVLARVPLFVFGALQASLLKGLAVAAATGDRSGFRHLLVRTCAVVVGLGVLGGVPAVVLGPWLISTLFDAPDVLRPLDFVWLSSGTICYMLAMVLGQAVMTLGRHHLQLLSWVVGTAVLVAVTLGPGPVQERVEIAYAAGSLAVALALVVSLRGAGARSAGSPAEARKSPGVRGAGGLPVNRRPNG